MLKAGGISGNNTKEIAETLLIGIVEAPLRNCLIKRSFVETAGKLLVFIL